MFRVLLIAVIFTLVASDGLVGQTKSRRGRFFQKIKEDIFGSPKQTDGQQQAKRQQSPNARTQLPQGRTPTPIKRSNSSLLGKPNQTGNSTAAVKPDGSNNYDRAVFSRQGVAHQASAASGSTGPNRISAPATKSQKNGFGFTVAVDKKNQLLVSSVEKNGNAAEAGFRRGDRVTEIGGIEATSVEEFDEIAKIMGQGDEMEFKISRGGKSKSIGVRYGAAPEVADTPLSPEPSKFKSDRRYDFSPPNSPKHEGAQSVLSNRPTASFARNVVSDQPPSSNRQIQLLNQTIANQNRQIQQLRQQIQQLRLNSRSR